MDDADGKARQDFIDTAIAKWNAGLISFPMKSLAPQVAPLESWPKRSGMIDRIIYLKQVGSDSKNGDVVFACSYKYGESPYIKWLAHDLDKNSKRRKHIEQRLSTLGCPPNDNFHIDAYPANFFSNDDPVEFATSTAVGRFVLWTILKEEFTMDLDQAAAMEKLLSPMRPYSPHENAKGW